MTKSLGTAIKEVGSTWGFILYVALAYLAAAALFITIPYITVLTIFGSFDHPYSGNVLVLVAVIEAIVVGFIAHVRHVMNQPEDCDEV